MGDAMIASFQLRTISSELPWGETHKLKASQYFVPQVEGPLKLPEVLCIAVKHDSVPDSSKGITFGSHQNCGVVLPKHDSISKFHFSLTFDDQDRLIIRDHSINGTEVKYGEQGAGLRSKRQWILNDPKLPSEFRPGVISFDVSVRLMMSAEELYKKVVDRFRSSCEEKEGVADYMLRMGVNPTVVERDPDDADIWLHWEVAEGTSASITRCWNTENGLEKVVKTRHNDCDQRRWSQQVNFMRTLQHHHHVINIQRFSNTSEGSPTQIEMDYLSRGSLDDPKDPSPVSKNPSQFSQQEARSILAQCLSVLVEMHTQTPPICHQDIKPSNILIEHRTSSSICVKLAGFSESNTEGERDMRGRDALYACPNHWAGICDPSLDIWLLGHTILALLDKDLQNLYCTNKTKFWDVAFRSEDSLVEFLLSRMIHQTAGLRSTATECLERLQELQLEERHGPIVLCGCSDEIDLTHKVRVRR
ncbi:unnamed protein product [Clonostachys rhizophaga]|uniref:Uncharacterized protein n=1 Tax=Clonostachys rhizophaga TaxID=160324 RepID=A0A9N9YX05_9HYPO|nr:unnamed protein product [Clonostachys rhizophaga]